LQDQQSSGFSQGFILTVEFAFQTLVLGFQGAQCLAVIATRTRLSGRTKIALPLGELMGK